MTSHIQGLRLWLLQRLSAAYMLVYMILAFTWTYSVYPIDYFTWQSLFASPFVNICSQLFLYLLLIHAWIGVRDIFIDYVPNLSLRFVLLTGASLLQLILAAWVFMTFYSVVKL